MRVLVDLVHPAHVHFFRNAISIWKSAGHEVLVTARDKDLAYTLLDLYGIPYLKMGKARQGKLAIALELIYRCGRFWGITSRFRPDVMLGIAGPGMAHVGWARRIPSLVFTDTENAILSNRITFPFATTVHTPACYENDVSSAEHARYPGYHELAYTHPDRFEPDPSVLETWGLTKDEVIVVARFVSWQALHDTHDHGVTDAVSLVESLGRFGRVLITSEDPLPPELEHLRIEAEPHKIHHLLAFATLFIGESATMASESATLGTPAIFISTSTRGYTNEQGAKYGLVHTFSDPVEAQRQALEKAVEILSDPETGDTAQRQRRQLLAENIDVTEYVVTQAESYAPRPSQQDRG